MIYHPAMPILGHGVDIVEVARVGRLLDDHAERFIERCFTPSEVGHAGDGPRRLEHLAGRFAAKEAVLKALATGLTQGIAWTDIEVVPEGSGAPTVRLSGMAARIASDRGISRIWLSISHISTHAVASAVAVGE